MDLHLVIRRSDYHWEIPQHGAMRVSAVIYASEQLMRDMDHKVYEQAVNVAVLPGIVRASYARPYSTRRSPGHSASRRATSWS